MGGRERFDEEVNNVLRYSALVYHAMYNILCSHLFPISIFFPGVDITSPFPQAPIRSQFIDSRGYFTQRHTSPEPQYADSASMH